MQQKIEFYVPGKPATAGSKRPFTNKTTGKTFLAPDNKRAPVWMAVVQDRALNAMQEGGLQPFMTQALLLETTFIAERPKKHYQTGKRASELREDAPQCPKSKPDVTKLVRCLEDALTGICWKDDGQVSDQVNRKRYAAPGQIPGVHVCISVMEE